MTDKSMLRRLSGRLSLLLLLAASMRPAVGETIQLERTRHGTYTISVQINGAVVTCSPIMYQWQVESFQKIERADRDSKGRAERPPRVWRSPPLAAAETPSASDNRGCYAA